MNGRYYNQFEDGYNCSTDSIHEVGNFSDIGSENQAIYTFYEQEKFINGHMYTTLFKHLRQYSSAGNNYFMEFQEEKAKRIVMSHWPNRTLCLTSLRRILVFFPFQLSLVGYIQDSTCALGQNRVEKMPIELDSKYGLLLTQKTSKNNIYKQEPESLGNRSEIAFSSKETSSQLFITQSKFTILINQNKGCLPRLKMCWSTTWSLAGGSVTRTTNKEFPLVSTQMYRHCSARWLRGLYRALGC